MRTEKTFLDQLPHHVLNHLLDLLNSRSLLKISMTSRYWNQLVFNENERSWARWQSLFQRAATATSLALHSSFADFEELSDEGLAKFWCSKVAHLDRCRTLSWWSEGREELQESLSSIGSDSGEDSPTTRAIRAGFQNPLNVTLPPSSVEKFARSGHTATEVGNLVVVIGGLSKEQQALGDVVVLDVKKMSVFWPEVEHTEGCTFLPKRLRHTACLLSPGTSERPSILVIGGHDLEREYDCKELYKLTVLEEGRRVLWSKVTCTGSIPSPRHHHTSVVFDSGRKLLLFGGGVNALDYVSEDEERLNLGERDPPNVVVYVLDLETFEWSRQDTRGTNPGIRSLHMACSYRN